jgi:hypothetical protein
VPHPSRTVLLPPSYMSLLLKPNSVDAVDEESQNHEPEHDLAGQNIETDENKMAALSLKLIEEIVNSTDNLPDQIIEAAKAISKISSGINATMISLCLLTRITNPLLFSGFRTTRRISSEL